MSKQGRSVDRHFIGYAMMSGRIFLYRSSSLSSSNATRVALDKRDATDECMQAAVNHLLHDPERKGFGDGVEMDVFHNGRAYTLSLVPKPGRPRGKRGKKS